MTLFNELKRRNVIRVALGIAAYWNRFGAPERCRKDNDGDYRCEE